MHIHKIVFLFLIVFLSENCASSKYQSNSFRILTVGSGRASEKAIQSNSPNMKQSTCCDASELIAKSNSNFLNTTVEIRGDEQNFSLNVTTKGKLQTMGLVSDCRSSQNEFEECTCELKSDAKSSANPKINTSKTGWVDNSTFYMISEGKASENAISKNSQAMREASCIESARVNALGHLILSAGKKGTRDLTNLNNKFNLPPVYFRTCISPEDDYKRCKCEIAVQGDNLLIEILKSWPE